MVRNISKIMDRQQLTKLLEDAEELYRVHEAGVSDPTKCREFNSKASLFLGMLEEMKADSLADRMMDILGGCSPKDFSPCDNRLRTKGAMERLIERIRADLNQSPLSG
jgi:hypothetical protein